MPQGKLRIIAGKWRRRTIRFDSRANIRPTTDSARETLFNWLQQRIEGSCCLDLFAGSGALGFEVLSRGAERVVLVDFDHKIVANLRRTAEELSADTAEIIHSRAMEFLNETDMSFDIVFLDPPFYRNTTRSVIEILESKKRMNQGGCVYVEAEREAELTELSGYWEILREFRSGSRAHYLIGVRSETHTMHSKNL